MIAPLFHGRESLVAGRAAAQPSPHGVPAQPQPLGHAPNLDPEPRPPRVVHNPIRAGSRLGDRDCRRQDPHGQRQAQATARGQRRKRAQPVPGQLRKHPGRSARRPRAEPHSRSGAESAGGRGHQGRRGDGRGSGLAGGNGRHRELCLAGRRRWRGPGDGGGGDQVKLRGAAGTRVAPVKRLHPRCGRRAGPPVRRCAARTASIPLACSSGGGAPSLRRTRGGSSRSADRYGS